MDAKEVVDLVWTVDGIKDPLAQISICRFRTPGHALMANLAPMPLAPAAATFAAGTAPFPPLAPFGAGGGACPGAPAPSGAAAQAVATTPGLVSVPPAATLGTFGGAGPSVLPTFMMGNSTTVPFVDAEIARTMEPAQSRDDPEEFSALLRE